MLREASLPLVHVCMEVCMALPYAQTDILTARKPSSRRSKNNAPLESACWGTLPFHIDLLDRVEADICEASGDGDMLMISQQ